MNTYSNTSNDPKAIAHMVIAAIQQTDVWRYMKSLMDRQAGRHDQDDGDLWDEPDLDEFAEDAEFDDEGDDLAEEEFDLDEAEEDLDSLESARRDHGEEPVRAGRRRVDPSAAARKYAAQFNTPGRRAPYAPNMRPRLTETSPSDELYGDSVGGSEQAQDQWTDMSGKVATDPDGTDHVHGQGVDDRQKGHPSGTTRDVYATQRAAQRMAEEMARRWVERDDCHTGRDEAGRFLGQDDYDADYRY
jgi:hypothetical protein